MGRRHIPVSLKSTLASVFRCLQPSLKARLEPSLVHEGSNTICPQYSTNNLSQLCEKCAITTRSLIRHCEECESTDFKAVITEALNYPTGLDSRFITMLSHPHYQHHSKRGTKIARVWTPDNHETFVYCPLCRAVNQLSAFVDKLEPECNGNMTVNLEESFVDVLMDTDRRPLTRIHIFPWDSISSDQWWNFDFVPAANDTFGSVRRVNPQKCDIDLIHRWISACTQSHGDECNHPSFESDIPLLKYMRVIDVTKLCLVNAPANCTYLALSYVWGQKKQIRLSEDLLTKWSKPKALQHVELPRTIKDAISLTRKLKHQYLWVDSICIIHDNLDDRTHQIQQMYLIYNHAFLTIIVASGSSCEDGIAGLQVDRPRVPFQSFFFVDGVEYGSICDNIPQFLKRSVWNSRGWTFQENFCSRRSLIFTDYLTAFSCPQAAWREDWCLEPRDTEIDSSDSRHPVYDISRVLMNHDPISRTNAIPTEYEYELSDFFRLVHTYLCRQLSDQNDILNAFNGISEKLKPILGPVLFGQPERHFDIALTWKDLECTKRRVGFPSWSWAGWCRVGLKSDIMLPEASGSLVSVLTVFTYHDYELQRVPYAKLDVRHPIQRHGHFQHGQLGTKKAKLDEIDTSQLIILTTSTVRVNLIHSKSITSGNLHTYDIFLRDHPGERIVDRYEALLSVQILEDLAPNSSIEYGFIVVAFHEAADYLATILVEFDHGIAYRLDTDIAKIALEEWWSFNPDKEVVIMG